MKDKSVSPKPRRRRRPRYAEVLLAIQRLLAIHAKMLAPTKDWDFAALEVKYHTQRQKIRRLLREGFRGPPARRRD